MKTTIVTVGGAAATAAIGGIAADPGSTWYRSLRKPRWQPPPPAYALVWTRCM
jgi:translocator protein